VSAASTSTAFAAWSSRITTQFRKIFLTPSSATSARSRTAKRSTKTGRSRRRLLRPAVYLSSQIEHLCPYCLEKVRRNDPRGIKICKVCKTWHHADCWAVTGVCQVPHEYVN
jgi:ribosomal protein L37AE/L43A